MAREERRYQASCLPFPERNPDDRDDPDLDREHGRRKDTALDDSRENEPNEEERVVTEEHAVDDVSTGKVPSQASWNDSNRHPGLSHMCAWYGSFRDFKNAGARNDEETIIDVFRADRHTFVELAELNILSKDEAASKGAVDWGDNDNGWIQRARIRSVHLIRLISYMTGRAEGWGFASGRTHHVFARPFMLFSVLQPHMKKCLSILEEGCSKGKQTKLTDRSEEVRNDCEQSRMDPEAQYKTKKQDSLTYSGEILDIDAVSTVLDRNSIDPLATLKHLRCYVDFIEENVMHLYELPVERPRQKIRYSDIPTVFQPGELLYAAQSRKDKFKDRHDHSALRMYSIGSPWVTSKDFLYDDLLATKRNHLVMYIYCYQVDYDGTSYVAIPVGFRIMYFEGLKDVKSLDVFPLRFVENSEKLVQELQIQGQQFLSVVKEKHLYYEGWTYENLTEEKSDTRCQVAEYTEGEVMLDFGEVSRKFSMYKSMKDLDFSNSKEYRFFQEHYPGLGSQRTPSAGDDEEKVEIIHIENLTQYLAGPSFKRNDFLRSWEAGEHVIRPQGDDFVLLPRRVMAYALRERKFFLVDTLSLRNIQWQASIFQDLKIEKSHRLMVEALVQAHLNKQQFRHDGDCSGLNQDIVRGKGSGLIILLHGVPGVGKTATAEAVAQANKRPLFPITCGDLGTTQSSVETALKDIFRLAHLWQCVLLLDEADVFLTRRDPSDIKRNALVSVFLRVLEYYNGVLFLTTNRVGILDEAFKSRIHLSLYYEPLSLHQTLAIFEVNVRRLQDIETEKQALSKSNGRQYTPLEIDGPDITKYAKRQYNRRNSHRWNGRQIRNAFQIASSLARFDAEKSVLEGVSKKDRPAEGSPLCLDHRQFELVAQATEKFDAYLYEASGKNDEDHARDQSIRADNFTSRSNQASRPQSYKPRHNPHPRYHEPEMSVRSSHYANPDRRSTRGSDYEHSPRRAPYRSNYGGSRDSDYRPHSHPHPRELSPRYPLQDNKRSSRREAPPREGQVPSRPRNDRDYSGWSRTGSGHEHDHPPTASGSEHPKHSDERCYDDEYENYSGSEDERDHSDHGGAQRY